MDEILLTPSSLLSILVQIDELKDKNIQVVEGLDGTLQICIGDSTYVIEEKNPVEFEVENEVVYEVDDLNQETYEDLKETEGIELSDSIEAGVLSQLFKTLAVGGLVRLTAKMLSPKEEKLFDKYTQEQMTERERREAKKNNVYQFKNKR